MFCQEPLDITLRETETKRPDAGTRRPMDDLRRPLAQHRIVQSPPQVKDHEKPAPPFPPSGPLQRPNYKEEKDQGAICGGTPHRDPGPGEQTKKSHGDAPAIPISIPCRSNTPQPTSILWDSAIGVSDPMLGELGSAHAGPPGHSPALHSRAPECAVGKFAAMASCARCNRNPLKFPILLDSQGSLQLTNRRGSGRFIYPPYQERSPCSISPRSKSW